MNKRYYVSNQLAKHFSTFSLFVFFVLFFIACKKNVQITAIVEMPISEFQLVAKKKGIIISPKSEIQLVQRYGNAVNWERYIDSMQGLLKLKLKLKPKQNTISPLLSYIGPSIAHIYDYDNSFLASVSVPYGCYLLDAMDTYGILIPDCERVGASSTCAARLISGSVDQSDQSFLNDNQMQGGYFLPCVSYLLSDISIIINQEENLYDNNDPCPYGCGSSGGGNTGTLNKEFNPYIIDSDPDTYWWEDYSTDYPTQLLPSWNDMNNNYPKKQDGTEMCGSDVYNLIGGQVLANMPSTSYPNACALRVSRALNYSGIVIPEITGHTYKGSDNKNYFLSSAKLYNFMIKTFKIPPNSTGSIETFNQTQGGINGVNFQSHLFGKKGIYLMQASYPGRFGALGHASLYNGSSCVHNNCDGFSDGAYFDAEGGVHKITLFKLN